MREALRFLKEKAAIWNAERKFNRNPIINSQTKEQFIEKGIPFAIRGVIQDLYPNVRSVQMRLFGESQYFSIGKGTETLVWEDELQRLNSASRYTERMTAQFTRFNQVRDGSQVTGEMNPEIKKMHTGDRQKDSVRAIILRVIDSDLRRKEQELR